MELHKKGQSFQEEIIRFVLSAGMGFLVDNIAYFILYRNVLEQPTYEIFGHVFKNSTVSLFISFFMGVIVNFLMTRYIVFTESRTSFSKQLFRFLSVAFLGFFVTVYLLNFIISYFHFYPPVARVAAMLSLFFASFFVHKVFSFSLSIRNKHHATADTPASS